VLITGAFPFHFDNLKQLLEDIKESPPDLNPEKISPELLDLLQKILVQNPRQRLTLYQMKEHEWFENLTYKNKLTNALNDFGKFRFLS
jgi:serine/threonine protein kinase